MAKEPGWQSRYAAPNGGHSTGLFGHWVGMTFYPARVREKRGKKREKAKK